MGIGRTATAEILSREVREECATRGISYHTLHNSKANELAFTTLAGRKTVREFEIIFLKGPVFRISTRFLGYKDVMIRKGYNISLTNDLEGNRKIFAVELSDISAVNHLLIEMLNEGFTSNPETELIE